MPICNDGKRKWKSNQMKEEKLVTTLRSMLSIAVTVGMLGLPGGAWAAESPLAMIRSTVERAVAVLRNPAYQGQDKRQQRLDKVREIVLPQFDRQEVAKRTLGVYWRDRTENERKQFIDLFTELVERTYSSGL